MGRDGGRLFASWSGIWACFCGFIRCWRFHRGQTLSSWDLGHVVLAQEGGSTGKQKAEHLSA